MPLRPEQYTRLQYRFKYVEVADDHEEMLATVGRDALTGDPALVVQHPGEYYRVSCPFCSDTRKRLWINHRWGFLDPRTQSRNLWLAICYDEDCLRLPERQRWLYSEVFSDVGDGTDVVLAGTRPAAVSRDFVWPGRMSHLHHLYEDHPALTYLRERGFDPVQLSHRLGLAYCFSGYPEFRLAGGRLIIPIYSDGKPVGWQARYIGDPPDKSVPKYFTMTGFKKTQYLYNLDTARRYPYVIVCEGCTDVWRVGPTAVALFGKTLSTTQRLLLGTHWSQGAAVVLLDSDAGDEGQAVYDALRDVVAQRVLVRLPDGKDPADMDRGVLNRLILAAGREQGVDLPSMFRDKGAKSTSGPATPTG
jgi:hypothetical protein